MRRQVRASNFDLPVSLGLQLADRALKIIRNKIGIDVAVEALKDYRRLRKGTVDALWNLADRLRMSRVIRPYWDAMS